MALCHGLVSEASQQPTRQAGAEACPLDNPHRVNAAGVAVTKSRFALLGPTRREPGPSCVRASCRGSVGVRYTHPAPRGLGFSSSVLVGNVRKLRVVIQFMDMRWRKCLGDADGIVSGADGHNSPAPRPGVRGQLVPAVRRSNIYAITDRMELIALTRGEARPKASGYRGLGGRSVRAG
jgi:hypothetical protein